MLKMIWTCEQLKGVLDKKCSIYGAGDGARNVIRYASKNGYSINSIIVSSKENNPSDIWGINVVEKSELDNDFSDVIIVTTTEKHHSDILEQIKNIKINLDNVFFMTDDLYFELKGVSINDSVRLIDCINELNASLSRIEWNNNFMRKESMKFIPRPNLEYVIIHILDHCNLRCQGCDHFACIADENFISFDTVSKDIKRLAEIFGGDYITRFAIMGGEPLLHPDLEKIVCVLRESFPYARIDISTNGILLMKKDARFWEICRDNDVTINVTKYPINLDFEIMKDKATSEKVKFLYHAGSGEAFEKKSFKKLINLNGDSDPVESFYKCHISNFGNMLLDGKLYGCAFSCQSYRVFNERFNKNLRMTNDDYIDIYENHKIKDFCEFAARPHHYCRYCYGLSPEFKWDRTKGDISEWVDVNGEICNECHRE